MINKFVKIFILIMFMFGMSFSLLSDIDKCVYEINSFVKNSYKIEAEVIHFTTHKSGTRKNRKIGYSAIYKYNHPTLGAIKLKSDIYTSRIPKIGNVKTIYYNPEYPNTYYNGILDVLLPILVVGICCTTSSAIIICEIFSKNEKEN